MTGRRNISWSTAMRDLRNDRIRREGVREEPLRATGDPSDAGAALSAWRGRSGRRYVVGVHRLAEADLMGAVNAVIIAVRRDEVARIIDMATAGARPNSAGRARWLAAMQAQGANEIHIHRLAATEEERRALIDDLRDGTSSV